MELGLTKN